MSLHDFEKWLNKRYPNETRTKILLTEYDVFVKAPLEKLLKDCPWIEEKRNMFDDISFSKDEIKELLEKGYHIDVSQDTNKDMHYKYDFMPYEYSLNITISKDNRVALELYNNGTESYHHVLEPFYAFKDSGMVHIYDD